ncbi:porin family protein [Fibrella forsythiae]|uniref:PorT family protein n=1 Tax=Fibrella forsythiae TaxID=2817061 RepID=A0ABS3JFM6_9BACT|nr:porin family protein [Fibrella forsythiae]MBO0948795.1 PorT family protein [Fibrella forsythiae]
MQNVRFALLFVTLLLVQSIGYSQSRQRWSFGPRVGLNLTNFVGGATNFAGSDVQNTKQVLLPGLSAGLGFVYSDISRFGFGVDLLYSQRGTMIKDGFGPGTEKVYRVNYLELPLIGRYYLTSGGKFRPNLYLGAVPALRLNAKVDVDNGTNTNYADDTQSYRAADLGLTGGVQLNWGTGDRQHFTIDARYTHGVSNISARTSDLRNQMITIGLGYNFGIGRQYQPGDRKLPIRPR